MQAGHLHRRLHRLRRHQLRPRLLQRLYLLQLRLRSMVQLGVRMLPDVIAGADLAV